MKTSSKHDPTKEHAEFLTARQLAEVLQISESTLMRLARAGRIPSIRLTPRLIRFRLASVRKSLEKESRMHQMDPEPEVDPAQMTFDDLIN
jgi:excisionase family DNA binding protein